MRTMELVTLEASESLIGNNSPAAGDNTKTLIFVS